MVQLDMNWCSMTLVSVTETTKNAELKLMEQPNVKWNSDLLGA